MRPQEVKKAEKNNTSNGTRWIENHQNHNFGYINNMKHIQYNADKITITTCKTSTPRLQGDISSNSWLIFQNQLKNILLDKVQKQLTAAMNVDTVDILTLHDKYKQILYKSRIISTI